MAKRRKKTRAARSCSKKLIRFKTKRGRVISFYGRSGASCAPRKFSAGMARRLRPWALAAKKCARRGVRVGTKAMGLCVKRSA